MVKSATTYLSLTGIIAALFSTWYAYDQGYLLIIWPHKQSAASVFPQKSALLYLYDPIDQYILHEEQVDYPAVETSIDAVQELIKLWVTRAHDQNIIASNALVQNICIGTQSNGLACINLTADPYKRHWSISQRWRCINSLCKTLCKQSIMPISQLAIMVQSKMHNDPYLDTLRPYLVAEHMDTSIADKPHADEIHYLPRIKKIVIDNGTSYGAGMGRVFTHEYERYIIEQLLTALITDNKSEQKRRAIHASVNGIPRDADLSNDHYEITSIINRMSPDLSIVFTAYPCESTVPQIHLYYYARQATDLWSVARTTSFVSIWQGHKGLAKSNKAIAIYLANSLKRVLKQSALIHPPCAIPIKALLGRNHPALLVELGLPHDRWQEQPCASLLQALSQAINQIGIAQS